MLFDLVTGKKTLTVNTDTYDPFVLRFNHDGSKLTSSGLDVTSVWDTHNGKQLTRQSVPEGNSELAGVSASGSYYFYDQDLLLTNALLIKNIGSQRNQLLVGNINNGNISSDNRLLAVGVNGKDESSLKIIDLEKTKVIATLKGDEADPYDDDLFFVNGNKRLLVRDYSDFHLWNIATKKLEYTWDTDDFGVDAIAATDSLLLIVDDNTFNKRVWRFSEKPKGNLALPIPQYAKGGISSVAISADQKSYALVTHNEDENLSFAFVIDMQSDKIISQYVSSSPFSQATFANNDQYVVLDGYPVEVIEASSGKQVYTISR